MVAVDLNPNNIEIARRYGYEGLYRRRHAAGHIGACRHLRSACGRPHRAGPRDDTPIEFTSSEISPRTPLSSPVVATTYFTGSYSMPGHMKSWTKKTSSDAAWPRKCGNSSGAWMRRQTNDSWDWSLTVVETEANPIRRSTTFFQRKKSPCGC